MRSWLSDASSAAMASLLRCSCAKGAVRYTVWTASKGAKGSCAGSFVDRRGSHRKRRGARA
eukprot:scaffold1052_cov339-Pavlova_lutheri.AAC.55